MEVAALIALGAVVFLLIRNVSDVPTDTIGLGGLSDSAKDQLESFGDALNDPVAIAEIEVGTTSKGGRGVGPPERYNIQSEIPLAWCARFARFCFAKAGTPLPGNPFLIPSVNALDAAVTAAGMMLPATATPQRGDLIFLRGIGDGDPDQINLGGRHVGIVEIVTDDTVTSIDGDFGEPDAVRRVTRQRSAANISGYGRVNQSVGDGNA